jgi:hypothetical protein
MSTKNRSKTGPITTTGKVRQVVLESKDQIWTYSDFVGMPVTAVSQALSRLSRQGEIQRVRKGVYYRPKPTIIGKSRASDTALAAKMLSSDRGLRPAGTTAAQILGMTTQNPAQTTYAISKSTAPSKLRGVKIKVGRPATSSELSAFEAAVLEFLRDRGRTGELSPDETVRQLLRTLVEDNHYANLVKAAANEPPRVRALLGAIGQQIGTEESNLRKLRDSLNRLSRFDFGKLNALRHAKEWQSK